MDQGLSVRRAEKLAKTFLKPSAPASRPGKTKDIMELEQRLRKALASKVDIKDRGGRGQIIIRYYSQGEFNRLLERLSEEEV
jgi:ParB family chromosome partitioning protein